MKKALLANSISFFLVLMLLSLNSLHAQIIVSSDFEGGNGIATFTDTATNEVDILSELKGGDTKNIVYYVKIAGLNPAMPLTLKVSSFWSGPMIVYSYDNIHWEKVLKNGNSQFIIPLISSTVYVAHSYPYTYSDMLADVNQISDLEFVVVKDLTTSEGGRAVPLVRITDDCAADSTKELIWIFGRMHAFENPGNIVVKGILDFFVSNQPAAVQLRKEAIIYVVPMMDVDQAFNGGSGKDQTPVDFNRDWISLNHSSHWNAVKTAKRWIDSTAQLNRFSVFFDSHSPPPGGPSLFYYIYELNHQLANARFVKETIKMLGNYQATELIYDGLDVSTSQDYVLSVYDQPTHYNVTMETGFNKRTDGEDWTKDLYLLNGEYHDHAISDYIHGLAKESDLLIDNKDTAQVDVIGNWQSDTAILGYFGEDYLFADSSSLSSIVFNATVPAAGKYEVFTRWVSDANFATDAFASVLHSGITRDFSLDMSLRGGNWISLDTFNLGAGETVSLTIDNANAAKTIIADGFRISKVKNCETVSIQDLPLEQALHFKIYPNPATDYFTVQLNDHLELKSVKVFSIIGQLILVSDQITVDISDLSAGLYIVEVETNQGKGVRRLVRR